MNENMANDEMPTSVFFKIFISVTTQVGCKSVMAMSLLWDKLCASLAA